MGWTIIGVLILIGLLFLLLEILVLPGTNVAGVLGFALIAIGVWQAYASHGAIAGTITLLSSMVVSISGLYFSLKSGTWKRASLNKNIEGRVNVLDQQKIKKGDQGKTVGRLAPMGKAIFNGEYYEVRTNSSFINPGTAIEVVDISGNKITVKPL